MKSTRIDFTGFNYKEFCDETKKWGLLQWEYNFGQGEATIYQPSDVVLEVFPEYSQRILATEEPTYAQAMRDALKAYNNKI